DATNMPSIHTPLPPITTVFTQFVSAQLFNAVLFYIVHRILHEIPYLYRTVHKKHHKYVGTIGFAAEYSHPIAQIFANNIPTVGYCLFFGVHPLVWLVWLAWRLEETYEGHSGFCFENTLLGRIGLLNGHQARFHDFHHTENRGNYGHDVID